MPNEEHTSDGIGILAIDVYFPKKFVCQHKLEQHDGASTGKYTIGLGQDKMAFCDDLEDIVSVCMSGVQNFMEKYNVEYSDIGRLEVGTETIIDKSKSTKSFLMELFVSSGNSSVEGVDSVNACYGGTSALFNACQWVDSSAWDGRKALVVAGDIAVYASGNARPSGGCGVAVMLVGKNAPLALEFPLRGTYMQHVYDFYKPDLSSEYPYVDGPLSVVAYNRAVDKAYHSYLCKLEKLSQKSHTASLDDIDYVVFHSPYTKQVVKGFARLAYNDHLKTPSAASTAVLDEFSQLTIEESYANKSLERAAISLAKPLFSQKTEPSLLAAKAIGNMYTASVFFGLASLLCSVKSSDLLGKRIAIFSYGSGCAASFYSFRVTGDTSAMASALDIANRLSRRSEATPAEFEATLCLREASHNAVDYTPATSAESLWPGTYFLKAIDHKYRRTYARTDKEIRANGL